MTYEEIERKSPEEYAKRERNKLEYRYPDGESYLDVKERLNQVLLKIVGCRNSVLVVGHVVGERRGVDGVGGDSDRDGVLLGPAD